jgi:hypothetical protein
LPATPAGLEAVGYSRVWAAREGGRLGEATLPPTFSAATGSGEIIRVGQTTSYAGSASRSESCRLISSEIAGDRLAAGQARKPRLYWLGQQVVDCFYQQR